MSAEMIMVEHGNVVLKIREDEVSRYLAKGYNVINADGTVLKASVPNDLGTLQKAYREHVAEIEKLKKEIAELKAQPVPKTAEKAPTASTKKTTTKK